MGVIKLDTMKIINLIMVIVTGIMLVLVTFAVTRTDNARAELVNVNQRQDLSISDLQLKCRENELVMKNIDNNLNDIKSTVNSINRKVDKHMQGDIDAKRESVISN
jgi:hypothetical protein